MDDPPSRVFIELYWAICHHCIRPVIVQKMENKLILGRLGKEKEVLLKSIRIVFSAIHKV